MSRPGSDTSTSRGFRWLRLFPIAALLLIASGCTSLRTTQDQGIVNATGVPARIELEDVPFYPQEEYQCGPAALAALLTYAGKPQRPGDLSDFVYLPGKKGSLQAEMLGATRREGLVAFVLAPEIEALERELAAGHPAVVLQNLGTDWLPHWHYAAVIGYDLPRREIVLRSGSEKRVALSLDAFDQSWKRAARWGFLALPPGEVPATATESSYLEAASALERSDAHAAGTAYGSALARWPESLRARIGLGNLAYAQGRFDEAAKEYRRAADGHPASGDAWNNLAQALAELGQAKPALSAARHAVELGGPRAATYAETLRSIERGTSR